MRFGVLGPVRVVDDDGQAVPLGGARLRALLAMLLLDVGRPVPPARLIDGLYGDRPPTGAINALQSQVSRLRRLLPVEMDRAGYRLAVDPDEVDVHRFGRLAARGHEALAAGDHAAAAPVLREALSLWRGEPLSDVRAAPFAAGQVTRLVEARRRAVEDRAEAELVAPVAGPAGAVVGELRELVAADPLRERGWALLMRALVAEGRPAEALSVFAEARRVLADELGADPSPELRALHTAMLRGPGSSPPKEPTATHRTPRRERPDGAGRPTRPGLPEQLTSFVGRDDELGAVAAALTAARLVTLHGPGGSGKTRLAVESAARHPGEVRFAELAPATGAEVSRAVADAVGLRVAGLRDRELPGDAPPELVDRLLAALAGRELLLVLDNCEHVIGPAATLAARILAACPHVRILATSREPLGITGETLRPVGGLPEAAAVRLFTERAALVTPQSMIDDDDAVREICRTLDGLPLALELAAARLHALPVVEVAARVGDRFRLLSRGSRTAPERQRTLRAVVEWSWDLLSEPEQVLARRFTVFRGGCGLAAVEAVGGLGPDTVDLLGDLVGKSLIERDGDRYRMLETIRAFCAERLDDAGEAGELRRRHASHFLEMARTADPQLRAAGQLETLRRLDTDRDNLHAAVRDADPETALRLLSALSFYWWLRGLRAEAAEFARALLGRARTTELTEEYALCVLTARLGTAQDATEMRYLAGLTEPPRQPFLLYLSAIVAGPPSAEPGDGPALAERLRVHLRGDPWSEALGAIGAGWMVLLHGGPPDRAEREFRGALAGFRGLGERWGTMIALSSLAELAAARGDQAAVRDSMDAALRLAGELGATVDMADLLRSRAEMRLSTGEVDGATADLMRAVELARECGALELISAALLGLGRVAWGRGDCSEAKRLCLAALAECPRGWYSSHGSRVAILAVLGRIAEHDGDEGEAGRRYREVFTVSPGADGLVAHGEALERLIGLALRAGEPERAAVLAGAAGLLGGERDLTGAAAEVRAVLGEEGFAAARSRGAALSRAEALALIALP